MPPALPCPPLQAYLAPDGVSLANPLTVLESFATIEANNSYITLNASAPGETYASMDVQLVENNTLAIDGGWVRRMHLHGAWWHGAWRHARTPRLGRARRMWHPTSEPACVHSWP